MLLATFGVGALAHFVVTDREAVEIATAELVDTTAPLDVDRLRAMLTERARLTDPQGKVILQGESVSASLDTLISRDPIASHRIATLNAGVQRRGGLTIARSRIELVTRLNQNSMGGNGPQPSTWLIEWEPQPDGSWRVSELPSVSFQLGDPTALLSMLRAGFRFG